MCDKSEREKVLDGIETLFPADAVDNKTAIIGQVLLSSALRNTPYNWRSLPLEVLRRYLAICEDYERQSSSQGKAKRKALPNYLKCQFL